MATGGVDEGKTMEGSATICNACEINTPIKYCDTCVMNLCTTCSKAHHKFEPTKTHVLKTLTFSQSVTIKDVGSCSKHPGKKLEIVCQTCLIFICSSCKPDHQTHSLSSIVDDPNIYEHICNKQIRQLLEELRELEDIKRILEGHMDSYDKAIVEIDTRELELIDKVQKKAKKLREIIKELKDKRLEQLTGQVNGLLVKSQALDSKVTELSAIRKSKNYEFLAQKIAAAQTQIATLEAYKLSFKPLPESLKQCDIIPNVSDMSVIEGDLDNLFYEGGNQLIPPYEATNIIGQFAIVDPDTKDGYRFCKSDNDKPIILHGKQSDDIRILENGAIKKKKSSMKITEMVAYGGVYIARENPPNQTDLHLFGNNFNKSKKIKIDKSMTRTRALVSMQRDHFVLLEFEKKGYGNAEVNIRTVDISGKIVQTKAVVQVSALKFNDDDGHYVAIHNDKKHVTLFLRQGLYKIHIGTGYIVRTGHHIAMSLKANINCCLVDSADNTLLGDESGSIHLFDPAYNHKVILTVGLGGVVHDMMISRGRLLVSVSDRKKQTHGILIYA